MNDIESRLRATLDEQAGRAPRGDGLTKRILAEAAEPAPVLRPRHGWTTWTTPLLAAVAVAAVIAAVIGVSDLRHSAAPARPGVSPVVQPPSPSPSVTRVASPTPSVTHSASTHASPSATRTTPGGETVTGFLALDLTFVSEDEGWALGRANCVSGTGLCTALFHTTDGRAWVSMPGSDFRVPGVQNCAAPCVDHIRFANSAVGYAYGSDALFMTTDGGFHWTQQPGRGAEALETLDNNVIRLVSDGGGCPGPCNVRAQIAPVGSSAWVTVPLQAGTISPVNVQLARSGSAAYVLARKNPAGGAPNQTSTLYASTDNGASWRDHGEPCLQVGGNSGVPEVDSTAVAAAPGGAVSILCKPRDAPTPAFVAVSRDGGATFTRTAGAVRGAELLAGDPRTVLVAAGSVTYRATGASARWVAIPRPTGTVTFLGFESPSVGRAVTDGGRTVWTTTDGGLTWSAFDFP